MNGFVYAYDKREPDAEPRLVPEHWLGNAALGDHWVRTKPRQTAEETTPAKTAKITKE